jgi:hypothetical protein
MFLLLILGATTLLGCLSHIPASCRTGPRTCPSNPILKARCALAESPWFCCLLPKSARSPQHQEQGLTLRNAPLCAHFGLQLFPSQNRQNEHDSSILRLTVPVRKAGYEFSGRGIARTLIPVGHSARRFGPQTSGAETRMGETVRGFLTLS